MMVSYVQPVLKKTKMNKEDFNKIVERRVELINSVLNSKGKEYGADKDAFHNFNSGVGIGFSDSREKLAWEYMTKHLQSIKDLIDSVSKGNLPKEEVLEEKIGDAINYLILIEGMIKENYVKELPVRGSVQLQNG